MGFREVGERQVVPMRNEDPFVKIARGCSIPIWTPVEHRTFLRFDLGAPRDVENPFLSAATPTRVL